MSCSAILTHLFHGLIEMHFHFFVVVAVVTLYQSWFPFACAIGYVLLHHGVAGALDPTSVFNHPSALAHPWKWASIHALFIAGESLACLTAWRLNELALDNERSARTALERANRDLAEAQELASVGSWEWDMETDKVLWSEELFRIFDKDPETFTPTLVGFLELVHPDDRLHMTAQIEAAREGTRVLDTDCRIVRPDGSVRIVHAIGTVAQEADESGRRMVGTCQDVTEQKLLEQEIEYKAFHDPLTGLANRGLFRDRLSHALSRRDSGGAVAVIFMDLDDFKSVNDSLGHGMGDQLLFNVARILESQVRASDTIARFGGDEFAILVDEDGAPAAVGVAQRVQEALSHPVAVDAGEATVRPSMGIAIAGHITTQDDLLRDADIAMYSVKAENKGGFQVCSSEMRKSVIKRLELKTELQRAIEREEFTLHYQPIFCLDTRDVIAVEALVRWDHPHWGLVPPGDFIPLAEETGLIVPLGTWILREATRQAKALQEPTGNHFALNVNLSARQLRETDMVSVVQQALLASRLLPSDLTLEVTETVLMGSVNASMAALNELRDLGIRIAIDDFGTGYSSLSYLHQFPIDTLKIDRSFLIGAVEGRDEEALAEAVVKLAAALDLSTVAEGIETEEQLEKMLDLGCNAGQGFLFARQLPFAEIQAWRTDYQGFAALVATGAVPN
ncbi:MAG TPA: EAL domain-containing protein [Actinomycetota bacterium]|nr:EAL domain-containing protein [Actinomycetota bacterium]